MATAPSEQDIREVGTTSPRRSRPGARTRSRPSTTRRWTSPRQDAQLQGRAVPLRRRRPRLPLARRPRPPPQRLPDRGRRAPAAARGRDADVRRRAPGRTALGAAAAAGVRHMAHRFIVGESPEAALGVLEGLWSAASPSSVDLLGEATVTAAEADRYAARCARGARDGSRAPRGAGRRGRAARARRRAGRCRARTSRVKVSALTPLLRPDAPERGQRDAAAPPARAAAPGQGPRRAPAHRHGVLRLARGDHRPRPRPARARTSSATARPPGVVLQAYLRDSPELLDRILESLARHAARHAARRPPRQGRLLGPRGRRGPPARLERARLRGQGGLRPQLRGAHPAPAGGAAARAASRSPPTTCAPSRTPSRANRALGGGDADLELQVLRGLGDDLAGRAGRQRPARPHLLPGRRPRRRAWPTSCAGCSRTRATSRFLADQAEGVAARGAAGRRHERTLPPPFANEPVLELRRAPERAAARSTRSAELDAALPLRVAGVDRRRPPRRRRPRLDRPRRPRPRRRARRRCATPGRRRRRASAAAERGRRAWARAPGGRARRGPARAPRPDARAPRARSPRWPCASARKPWARGRRRRLRGDRLPRVLRARRDRARPRARRCSRSPGERNTMRYRPRGVVARRSRPGTSRSRSRTGMIAAALATGNAVDPQARRAGARLRR